MIIAGLQKSSLIDYPEKIAAVIFTCGCNFKCPFCHNGGLINSKNENQINSEYILDFLKKRTGKLEGVVISGGEPTIQKDLKDFIIKIKELNYSIKLDTNGSNPAIIKYLTKNKLIDYIAMDIKSPMKKYEIATNSSVDINKIKESIRYLLKNNIDYEFRTTVVRECLDFNDFKIIAKEISGAKKYYIQKFIPENAYSKNFRNKTTYTLQELEKIKEILEKTVENVYIR